MLKTIFVIFLLKLLTCNVLAQVDKEKLRNTPINYFKTVDEKYNNYIYDPDVNPPWVIHTEPLKGEAVFVDHEALELAIPNDVTSATVRIDLKHCRNSIWDTPVSCFCYKVDTVGLSSKSIKMFAKSCQSREMVPICHSTSIDTASIIYEDEKHDIRLLKSNNSEPYVQFDIDFANEKVIVRELTLPFPLVKKMYRIGSYDQIKVLEFKAPSCIHIEFENLIYAGNLIQSTPFPRPLLPNKCRAGCACSGMFDVEGKEIAIDPIESKSNEIELIGGFIIMIITFIFNHF